ncbi:putative folate synthesis protein [Bifidobacterium gallicum DSM 20093 = LMG 11596]|nr:putative folate synthesis protein [Bifidobacterium gallicum DSM 20093 = LMG 11596]
MSRRRAEPMKAGPFLIEAEWEQDEHGARLEMRVHVAGMPSDEIGTSFNIAVPASIIEQAVNRESVTVDHNDVEQNNGSDAQMTSCENKESNSSERNTVQQTAVIFMESAVQSAEALFRKSIVSIDAVPGNMVEGVSPLYHVTHYDALDTQTAVVQIRTILEPDTLQHVLSDLSVAHEGLVSLSCVSFDGAGMGEDIQRAAVLAPWLDMDPNGEVNGDPLAFLLAMAPDATQVAMVSDTWLLRNAAQSMDAPCAGTLAKDAPKVEGVHKPGARMDDRLGEAEGHAAGNAYDGTEGK